MKMKNIFSVLFFGIIILSGFVMADGKNSKCVSGIVDYTPDNLIWGHYDWCVGPDENNSCGSGHNDCIATHGKACYYGDGNKKCKACADDNSGTASKLKDATDNPNEKFKCIEWQIDLPVDGVDYATGKADANGKIVQTGDNWQDSKYNWEDCKECKDLNVNIYDLNADNVYFQGSINGESWVDNTVLFKIEIYQDDNGNSIFEPSELKDTIYPSAGAVCQGDVHNKNCNNDRVKTRPRSCEVTWVSGQSSVLYNKYKSQKIVGYVKPFEQNSGTPDWKSQTPCVYIRQGEPAPYCGDGIFNEEIDGVCEYKGPIYLNGMVCNNNQNECRQDCTCCGDGIWQQEHGEECDDGNTIDDDFCSNTCEKTYQPSCGNNIIDDDELCDYNAWATGVQCVQMPGSSDVCRMGPLYGDTQCTCCGDGIIQWNTCGPEPDCIEFIEQCEQDSDCPDDLDGKTLEGCENCVCKYKTNPQCDPDDAMVFDPQPEKDIPFEIKVTSDLPYGWVVVTVNGVNLGGPLSVDNIGGRWQWTWQYTATSYGTYDVRFYMNAEYDNPEVGIECANREFTISEEQPYCGDDFINQPSETCDDTDFTDGIDYGDTVCWIKVQDYAQSTYCRMVGEKPCTCCGDSIIQTAYGEKCDDGNTVDEPNSDLNQCRNDCTFCGDGTLDAGEECDDGNKIDGDGCALDCTTENDIPEFSFITGALAAISVLILLFIKRKR